MGDESVDGGRIRPRAWTLDEWYEQNSLWRTAAAAPGAAAIEPARAEAYSAHHWVVTYTVGEAGLRVGSHIALEVPAGWTPDLGRPLHTGRRVLVPAGEVNPGYAAWLAVDADGEAWFDAAVSDCTRFQVVDCVLADGHLERGRRVRLHLGSTAGSRLRCQWLAQETPLAMAVDFQGLGVYSPVLPPPTVTVTGSKAAALRLVAPATVAPGRTFTVAVQALDRYGANPATGYAGKVALTTGGPVEAVPDEVRLLPEAGPEATVSVTAATAGVARVSAYDAVNALAGISNPIGVGFCDEDERIVFGDLHGQVYASIGTGTLDEYYDWARGVERLDFCAPANHYGGRMDFANLPGHDEEREEALRALWAEDVAACNRHYAPGEFATLVGFECGLGRHGHRNVYYRGDAGAFVPGQGGLTPEGLWQSLDRQGLAAITVPHHPKYCSPVDWVARDDRYQRLVEICSAWGISEEGGRHSVRAALAAGHRLGFVGGTDTHFGQPGRSPHFFGEGGGLAGVYVAALTREALWDALHARRCYATTGARILLDARINGSAMGSEITAAEALLAVRVVGTVPGYEVDVVRDGAVVHSVESAGIECRFTWADPAPAAGGEAPGGATYYYVRVRQPDRHLAWSSPIWVSPARR